MILFIKKLILWVSSDVFLLLYFFEKPLHRGISGTRHNSFSYEIGVIIKNVKASGFLYLCLLAISYFLKVKIL